MTDSIKEESLLEGENANYIDGLYEQFLNDPFLVNKSWRDYFADLPVPADLQQGLRHSEIQAQFRNASLFKSIHEPYYNGSGSSSESFTNDNNSTGDCSEQDIDAVVEAGRLQIRVLKLIESYRVLGHLHANIDPLSELHARSVINELTLQYHSLDQVDPNHIFDAGDLFIEESPTLENIHNNLRNAYTGSIGAEYMHIMDTEEKCWLQSRLESDQMMHYSEDHADSSLSPQDKINIYQQLVSAETFERYLSTRYVGQKTFSLEGGESLIPLLIAMTQKAGENHVEEIALGMAHRGRLNVLINLLGKPPERLFQEFAGMADDHQGYAGDVKYHKGYSSFIATDGGSVKITAAFNPSHLEIISPVVAGHVRARRDRRNTKDSDPVLAIIIHGDAAFAGQGVVMETLSMSQTRGFSINGTVHIVINNQIGFTTSTMSDSRSSYYSTDVAKMVNAPILHVNGDDPEAVVYVAKLALEYRLRFKKDIVIDMVCYRRRGHNEADEPSLTQPIMYRTINSKLTTRELYSNTLIDQQIISPQMAANAIKDYKHKMAEGTSLLGQTSVNTIPLKYQVNWSLYENRHWTDNADTTFDKPSFKELALQINTAPEDYNVHDRLQKVLEGRVEMANEERNVDWGFSENMAYATLLTEGFDVRLTGQDSGRGTFSHRHAVYHDQNNHRHIRNWTPLQHISENQGKCTIIDSLLSEEAVMAFEYGYSAADPKVLNIWEAQFGDFANGAQVVIDQFISSGEQKWGRLSGLTLFLPHGYEGMGAEHSSARLERYLQLCAQHNMQVCIPSTPTQIYHLIRRQMIRNYRKPLITFTPKSLLRYPKFTSTLDELCNGTFHPVLDDPIITDKTKATRVIMCSGKIYYDMLDKIKSNEFCHIALIRLEQLYPFPKFPLANILKKYPNKTEIVWCQEEPLNQGAWDSIKHRFNQYKKVGLEVTCISRSGSAAAAVGSFIKHKQEQEKLVNKALQINNRETHQ